MKQDKLYDARFIVEDVFAVICNTDNEEGRGKSYTQSLHVDHLKATLEAKGKGTYGSDAHVKTIKGAVIEISENGKKETYIVKMEELFKDVSQTDRAKMKALAKLTDAERQLLGL